ncbi:MAG: DNA repair protein RecO [Defluviitaleaceae bacterium]|nr:DNA repair protein RecO [Defluviitaleaceae bacterium]
MPTFKDKGLVLREVDTAENSKRLLLLTQQKGKIWVFARGAGNAKSKLKAPKMAFCEFVIYDGGQFLSLTQVSQIRTFNAIAGDFDGYCVANFLLEASDKMVLPEMRAEDTLKVILSAFVRLDRGYNPWLVFSSSTFKLLQLEGFVPITANCSSCNNVFPQKYFFGQDGVACEKCGEIPFSGEALLALEYILKAPIHEIFNFRASADVLDALVSAVLLFFGYHVDAQLKSMEFIRR